MAAQGHTPKTMSSRLMGMKFMQRSAASPTASKSSDPPSAKRSKLNSGSPHARRAADQEAFEEVQAQEDAKREAILDKLAEEAGDTKWVLKAPTKTKPIFSVVSAGYGAIDGTVAPSQDTQGHEESDGSDEGEGEVGNAKGAVDTAGGIAGRKSFGKFNRQIEKRHNPDLSSSSEDDDEDNKDNADDSSDDDDDDDRHGSTVTDEDTPRRKKSSSVAEELRAKKKAKLKEEKRASREKAEQRRSKEVKLNRNMTSISGSGFKGSKPQQACFTCGETGHKAADCPDRGRQKKQKRKST